MADRLSRSVVALALCAGVVSACTSQRSPVGTPLSSSSAHTSIAAQVSTPTSTSASTSVSLAGVPHFDHVVVVVLENHSFGELSSSSAMPFLHAIADRGALFDQSFAVTHPSQPNYLALFSGATQGILDDSCPHAFDGPNLGAALIAAGKTFVGYSEDLPAAGSTACWSGSYARKHSPWVNFTNVPASSNQSMSAFPSDYAKLPSVGFVIPNLDNDLHDGSAATADTWLRTHLSGFADWARDHNSLLVVTTDEDDRSANNRIFTVFSGAHVAAGRISERIDHYSVLRTLLDSVGLQPFGAAATAQPITAAWLPN